MNFTPNHDIYVSDCRDRTQTVNAHDGPNAYNCASLVFAKESKCIVPDSSSRWQG